MTAVCIVGLVEVSVRVYTSTSTEPPRPGTFRRCDARMPPLSSNVMMSCVRSAMLLCVGCYSAAETPAKPACTAGHAGRLWPEEANDNPKFAAALKPYGYPEMCMLEHGIYIWKTPTVSLDQLRRDASKKRPISSKANAAKKPSAN